MFLSTKLILSGLDAYTYTGHLSSEAKAHHERVRQWFINFENSKIDKPTILIDEEEKGVILYTNDALWEIVKKWQNKQLDNLNVLDGIKIWKEIKNIMEKKG